jgi:hypothetical protein
VQLKSQWGNNPLAFLKSSKNFQNLKITLESGFKQEYSVIRKKKEGLIKPTS